MKWVNHVLIAGSVTAVYDVRLVPPTIIGATAPDWMEWVLKFIGRPVKHRTVTHYLSVWSLCWLAAFSSAGGEWVDVGHSVLLGRGDACSHRCHDSVRGSVESVQ